LEKAALKETAEGYFVASWWPSAIRLAEHGELFGEGPDGGA
jgi:hypothetical protein